MNKVNNWMHLLRQIKVTGAVAFSSDSLVKQMVNKVDFSSAEIIIELGAGAGSITELIAEKKSPGTQVLVFEVNEYFCKLLRQRFPDRDIHIINDSAEHMEQYLKEITGRNNVDFIISSLPFSIINKKVRNNIIMAIQKLLTHHSMYIQFGYNKRRYKKILNHFETVKTTYVLGNLPPAYVFNCKLQENK